MGVTLGASPAKAQPRCADGRMFVGAGLTGAEDVTTPKDQQRADQIFTEALDRPPTSRKAFIDAACGQDEDLRSEVSDLLAHYASAEVALAPSLATHTIGGSRASGPLELQVTAGATVGTCRLEERLPDDDLFECWATTRQDGQTPAVLALARQRLDPDEARRVALRAEGLLHLDHPGLPRVLEAGTVDVGRGPEPFYLIEHIQGEPLAAGRASSSSDLRRRLEHLVQACDALQELHQRGLFHGRLDATRIRVVEGGVTRIGEPGLLAAVATAVPDSEAAAMLQTAPGRAPERSALAPVDLDGRTDVFDLGSTVNRWIEQREGALAQQVRPIADRAVSVDRQDRWRSAGALADALRAVLDPSPEDAASATSQGRVSVLVTSLLVLGAAVIGFLVGMMVFWSTTTAP